MALPRWLEQAVGVAKDVALPDVEAWKRVASGDGDLTDFLSVATDVVGVVPGGQLIKGAGRVGLAATKHADEVRALSKWDKNPLYHGMSNKLEGKVIQPASKGFKGANWERHGGGITRAEPHIKDSATRGLPQAVRNSIVGDLQRTQTPKMLDHSKYAFATPSTDYARKFATTYTKGPEPKILKVVPKSSGRNLLNRTSGAANRHDTLEVLSKRGYRVVGGNTKGQGRWLESDASREALEKALTKAKAEGKWALPAWVGIEGVDVSLDRDRQ